MDGESGFIEKDGVLRVHQWNAIQPGEVTHDDLGGPLAGCCVDHRREASAGVSVLGDEAHLGEADFAQVGTAELALPLYLLRRAACGACVDDRSAHHRPGLVQEAVTTDF